LLQLQVIDQDEAFAFVDKWHRHHDAPAGWRWGVAVNDGQRIVGVACVGRAVARGFCKEKVVEVNRLCLIPLDQGGVRNAGSKLLGACEAAALGRGILSVVSYIQAETENGSTYRAANWSPLYLTAGGDWSETRPRKAGENTGRKVCYVSPRSVDPRGLINQPRLRVEIPKTVQQIRLKFDEPA
jgi:hypothetical protein